MRLVGGGGTALHRGGILASHLAALGLNPIFCKKKIPAEKLSMLLRLIKGPGQRKVDSGLKMLIEPICLKIGIT